MKTSRYILVPSTLTISLKALLKMGLNILLMLTEFLNTAIKGTHSLASTPLIMNKFFYFCCISKCLIYRFVEGFYPINKNTRPPIKVPAENIPANTAASPTNLFSSSITIIVNTAVNNRPENPEAIIFSGLFIAS